MLKPMSSGYRGTICSAVAAITLLRVVQPTLQGQDERWLRDNDRGNRYEGVLDQPNAKREYEVLALFAFRGFPDRVTLAPNSELHVAYFVPANMRAEPVYIRARQLSSRTNYLLQVKPAKE